MRNRIDKMQKLQRILKLIIAIGVIILILLLAPMTKKIALIEPMITSIKERGIETTAFYYTEIEEFSTAEININNSFKYNPEFYYKGEEK